LIALHRTGTSDRLSGLQIEATHECGQPPKQHLLGFGQQRMRPVHRRAQRLLSSHCGARTPGQQPKAVVQAVEDLGKRQGTYPRGRKFNRQRHAVKALADLGQTRRRCRR
jgi:hypothetical protein